MRPVIHSKKHYVQESLATVLAGATKAITLVQAEPTPGATANQVEEGSSVRAVFVEMWIRAGDTSPGSTLVTLVKTTDSQTPVFADMVNLHAYNNKKNIFYHTQGLTNDQDADAIPFVRDWFKIPKGKQRFGQGDSLFLCVTAQALDNIICGFSVYKELS